MDKQIEKMQKLSADAEAIFGKAKTEARELNTEEYGQWEKIAGEIKGYYARTIEAGKELAGMHFAKRSV